MAANPHRMQRDFRLPVLLRKYSEKRYLAWAVLAVGMMAGRIALLPLLPPPEPSIQDEFSYLLAGDTFAHGRVANPPLAHPEFFESLQVLMRPTYASKYPPGQGIMLALGQRIFGHPYAGVVLEGGAMVFLFCWMAAAWMPPQWVLIGGGMSTVLFFVRHYWFDSYWGGCLSACGGALVVGGLGYVLRGRLTQARVSLGAGAVLLYFTRPYEGGVLCLVAAVVLAIHLFRSDAEGRKNFLRIAAPMNALVLLAGLGIAGWYNLRVTGHATVLPYQLYTQQVDSTPVFWILSPPPPKQYDYASQRTQHQWEWDIYQSLRELPLYRAFAMQLLFFLVSGVWLQFLALGLFLLAIPLARMQGRKKWLVLMAGAGVAAISIETWSIPHYSAPFTPVLLLLIVASARAVWYRLSAVRWGAPALALLACVILVFLVFDYQRVFMTPRATERSKLVRKLEGMGGSHLVFVQYSDDWLTWLPNGEWVYNGADPEKAPVLFAHLRTNPEDQDLLSEYPGRTAWIVKLGPKETDVSVEPYRVEAASASAAGGTLYQINRGAMSSRQP